MCRDKDYDKAIILRVGERFVCAYRNSRVLTAWSFAGAKLFAPWKLWQVEMIEEILDKKGREYERVLIDLSKINN